MFLEVEFHGGLGNQLFQYAAARNLSIKKGNCLLLLNTESYQNDSLGRVFGLSHFRIKGIIIKSTTITKIFRKRTKLNKIANAFSLFNNISEQGFVLHQLDGQTKLLTSMLGYWQSAYYFNEIRELLLKEFTPLLVPPPPDWINLDNTIAIHVRRTDYLVEGRYGFLGDKYYQEAMYMFKQTIKNPIFIFFSDDILWCKENFMDDRIIFFEDTDWDKDYLQLYLISKCKHQVIANSSFSWWGAWLNENPIKIVVRPGTPFREASLLYESHYPDEWISIENQL